jgi:hypothetical protein
MNSGRFVLTQILDLIHWQTLSRLVSKYNAESKVRHFGVRQQLICMAFAQLTWRNGLRDIEACLNAKPEELYLSGLSGTSSQIDFGRCQRVAGLAYLIQLVCSSDTACDERNLCPP